MTRSMQPTSAVRRGATRAHSRYDAAKPSLPHRSGADQRGSIEDEIARVLRKDVAALLQAGGGAARDGISLLEHLLNASMEAGVAGGEFATQVGGIARGVMAGVQDARGDLDKAAHEVVRLAVQQAHRARADVALVAQRAIHGVAHGAAEAGGDPGPSTRIAIHSALRTAAGLGVIAAEAVRLMVVHVFGALDATLSGEAAQDSGTG